MNLDRGFDIARGTCRYCGIEVWGHIAAGQNRKRLVLILDGHRSRAHLVRRPSAQAVEANMFRRLRPSRSPIRSAAATASIPLGEQAVMLGETK